MMTGIITKPLRLTWLSNAFNVTNNGDSFIEYTRTFLENDDSRKLI